MTLRRSFVLGVLLLTAVLLQVTLLPLVAGGGFVPDLVVVLLVVITLEVGPRPALWAAGLSGLLLDLLAVSIPLGSSVLVYATVVYGLALVRPYFFERAGLTTAILAGLAAAMSMAGQGGLQVLLTDQPPLAGSTVWLGSVVIGAFGVLLAPVVLIVVRRVLRGADISGVEIGG